MGLGNRPQMTGVGLDTGRLTRTRLLVIALAFVMVVAGVFMTSLARAETVPYSEEDYREVVDQLGCIQCNMRPLFGCETPTCQDSKALVRQKLEEGESPDEILQFFVDRYGDSILLSPPARGLNLLIWVLPAAALLAGAFAIGRVVGRRRSPTPATHVSSVDDEYEARVEEELRAIQRGPG